MSEREEKFEKMLRDILEEYDATVSKMEKLKDENKTKTVTYKQLMAKNLLSRILFPGIRYTGCWNN